MDITTATPAEIDGRAVEINQAIETIVNELRHRQHTIENPYVTEERRQQAQSEARELSEKHYRLNAELLAHAAEFARRGGWTRFYLVLNTGGHVHTSMDCDTCFVTTDFGWLTQFSGTTHEDMGALAGMDACARCFPSLPAEIMKAKRDARVDTPERIAAREKAAAEKAAKAAKAADKAIANPDGTPLMQVADTRDGGWRETTNVVKTEIAAKRNAMEAAYCIYFYNVMCNPNGTDHPDTAAWVETIRRNVEALAHKTGRTAEDIRAEIDKKVEAKYRRENG